jgi:hypothetical protein
LITGVVFVSFLATGVVTGSFLATGVVTGSFLTIGVLGELVFDGVNSVLAGTDVDEGWPFIAAAFLAYQREEYTNICFSFLFFYDTHNISNNCSK